MADGREILEPWLRGTRQDRPVLVRAVLHALDLAREDFARWVWPLDPGLLEQKPFGLPSVAFQSRHIVRSLDRLLTYAEGNSLSDGQRFLLASEGVSASEPAPQREFEEGLQLAERRICSLPLDELDGTRYVGRDRLPVTLAGLLVHLADHTQRHVGQAVTTVKVLRSLHDIEQS